VRKDRRGENRAMVVEVVLEVEGLLKPRRGRGRDRCKTET
jgi:hypothetical protein